MGEFDGFEPFNHSTDMGNTTWLINAQTQRLYEAGVQLFADASPYAASVQVCAPDGYVTVRRQLHTQAPGYPVASPTLGAQGGAGFNDPYIYTAIRTVPGVGEYSTLTTQTFHSPNPLTNGNRFVPTPEGPAGLVLGAPEATEELATTLDWLRDGIANTSELAPYMTWSEVVGAEAEAFQALVELVLKSLSIRPSHLDRPVFGTPKQTTGDEWALESLLVRPAKHVEPRIPANQLQANAILANQQVVVGRGLYNRKWSQTLLVHSIDMASRESMHFRTADDRAAAQQALERQLHPDNLRLGYGPKNKA